MTQAHFAVLVCVALWIFCLLFFLLCQKEDGKNLIIVIFLLVLCISCFLNYVKIKFFSKKCGKMKRNAV